ncbi:MAG UNVERIFIED_CONTAM: hypothetical protein LVR29_25775 [Microcystis novacekii LVE1205-3]
MPVKIAPEQMGESELQWSVVSGQEQDKEDFCCRLLPPLPIPYSPDFRVDDGTGSFSVRGRMGTLRFAHPTGLLPGEWQFPPDRGVRGGGWAADRTSLCETPVA